MELNGAAPVNGKSALPRTRTDNGAEWYYPGKREKALARSRPPTTELDASRDSTDRAADGPWIDLRILPKKTLMDGGISSGEKY